MAGPLAVRPLYLAIFLLSAATLAWEVVLSRVFAVTQFYHFAFLVVNLALLGFGAGGTFLSLRPRWTADDQQAAAWRPRLEALALGFAAALLGGYLFVNALPFDSYAIAWDRRQVALLAAYYLALAAPFFCVGVAVGLALAVSGPASHRVYAANLLGSAVGAAAAPALLNGLGIPAVLFPLAAAGVAAAAVAARRPSLLRFLFYAAALGSLMWATAAPPAAARLRLSPYKGLSQALLYPGSGVVAEDDSAVSRVTVIESAGVRSLPGLSFQYHGPLPPQFGLFTDGDDLSPVVDTRRPVDWAFLDYLPEALAYRLRPGAAALVLNPRGGLAIWQALEGGAAGRPVVAVEADPGVLRQLDRLLGDRSPYRQPQVVSAVETARSFLGRDRGRYGVIHVALVQPYRPVTSGAFSLSETYDLTVEAMRAYFDHLAPDGVLVISRWLQTPPSETVRTLALLREGLLAAGVEEPRAHLVALRGVQVATFLAKRTPWAAEELAEVRRFAQQRRLDLALAPDLQPSEINRFNVLPEPYYEEAYAALLAAADPRPFYAAQPFDVRPPTDDHPFFFHFFRWAQTPVVLATLGQTWQPFGGSGVLVLVALLILSVLASAALILLPLAVGRRAAGAAAERAAPARWRVLTYFAALGLGFLLVEIPLIQRFILLLGHPTLALTAVLAGLLLWSGVGSLLAPRLPWRGTLAALLAVGVAYQLLLGPLAGALLAASLAVRLAAAVALLAPLGLLMGVPFPRGIGWLAATGPQLTPWAWAINGCASVIASVLAALLALQWGFTAVTALGLLCYAAALTAIWAVDLTAGRPAVPRPPAAQSAPRPG
ncbi:MAG: hypothetical protein NZ528_10765 [Caldilineales bacterium]|nr:hypothetical protein [Caldilineales bacterium]MDW8317625.1 hypothetical protein [Anaerolineae bacterium]